VKLLPGTVSGESTRQRESLSRPVPSRLILERLYGVQAVPWRTRIKLRARAIKSRLADWARHERWSMMLAAASVLLVVLAHAYYYNTLLMLEQNVKTAWTKVEAGQQKRNHVMRNVTALLQFYTRYEQDLMKDIATLRGKARQEAPASDSAEPSKALGRLNAVAEQYPNLHLTSTVQQVTSAVVSTESEIAAYIIFYNDTATIYRTALNTFPTKIFGKILGFQQYPLYTPESPAVLKFMELTL
jgi:LemA protein